MIELVLFSSGGDFDYHSGNERLIVFKHEEYVEIHCFLPIYTKIYKNLSTLQGSDKNLRHID